MTDLNEWFEHKNIELKSNCNIIIEINNQLLFLDDKHCITSMYNAINEEFQSSYGSKNNNIQLNGLKIREQLVYWNENDKKMWFVSDYKLQSTNIGQQPKKMTNLSHGVYWTDHRYLVQYGNKVYFISSKDNYCIFEIDIDNNNMKLVKEERDDDSTARTDGVCILSPKKQLIFSLGGWNDRFWDQDCLPFRDISKFDISNGKWTKFEINLNIHKCGVILSKNEDYIYIFDDYQDDESLSTTTNEFLNSIRRINLTSGNYEIKESSIKCPIKGPCKVILHNNQKKTEFLTHGYIREIQDKYSLTGMPYQLVKLIIKILKVYELFLIHDRTNQCFSISWEKLKNSF